MDGNSQLPPDTAGPGLRFQVGEIGVQVISDGEVAYPLDFVFPDAPQQDLNAGLAGRLDERGNLPIPYQCLLITTPSQRVLVDSGLGQATAAAMGEPAGRMLESLAQAGVQPEDIDTVVISHAHPDHIGGLITKDELTFPGARHVIEAREWACWTDENQLAQLPELLTHTARAVLPMLASADAVDVVSGETEVVPGVLLLPAPGHTVGHCVVAFDSGSQQAIFLADAILDRLNLTYPTWVSAVDMVPEETVATRIRLLDEAARMASLVLAFHLVGVGHIERHDGGYQLVTT